MLRTAADMRAVGTFGTSQMPTIGDEGAAAILITFDIDATLLRVPRTNNCHSRAIWKAMRYVFGVEEDLCEYVGFRFHGKSDHTIIRSVVERANSGRSGSDALEREMAERAERYFAEDFDGRVEVLRGAERLLRELSARGNVDMAICSGNLPRIGEEKLKAAGLWGYFSDSGCGWGVADDRADMLRCALRSTMQRRNRKYDVVVHVGDALEDYQCAVDLDRKEEGVKVVPVAVLTGAVRDFPDGAFVINNLEEGHDEFFRFIDELTVRSKD